jgi:hypothetical protein
MLAVADVSTDSFLEYLCVLKTSKTYLASFDELSNVPRVYEELNFAAKDETVLLRIRYL